METKDMDNAIIDEICKIPIDKWGKLSYDYKGLHINLRHASFGMPASANINGIYFDGKKISDLCQQIKDMYNAEQDKEIERRKLDIYTQLCTDQNNSPNT